MPNVLLEAWANGLAVVSTPVGGVPEMIDHHINGVLSDDVSPESLSRAMAYVFRSPGLWRTMSLEGQAKLRSHFSFEKQAELLDTLYEEAHQAAIARQRERKTP